jgi:hypothetical protein
LLEHEHRRLGIAVCDEVPRFTDGKRAAAHVIPP